MTDSNMRRMQIAIIDTNLDDLEILESIIKEIDSDVNCISFVFADEAIRILGTELNTVPNYIFVNADLPRVNGSDCLRMLKQIPKLSACKIIMFAQVMPKAVGNAFISLGAFDFFQKPIVKSSYKAKIKKIFDKIPEVAI